MREGDHTDPVTGRPHATVTLWSLQALRGIAALMIVVGHAQTSVALRTADQSFHRSALLPWGASVDLFFVISGFVMVHASRRLFGTADGPHRFLLRRLARVVPLYWLATASMLVLIGIGSLKGGDPFPSLATVIASFAFVPVPDRNGALFPVLDLGWTLNYELFFYLVFAPFVVLARRRAVAGVALTLAALVVVGTVLPLQGSAWFWTRPITIDFVLGAGVGAAVAERWQWPAPVRGAVALAAVALFALDAMHVFAVPAGVTVANAWPRVVAAGLPCAALLAAATLGPEPPRPRLARPLAALGDASYSLYLLHPFVLIVMEKLMQKVPVVRQMPGMALAILAVSAAVALALLAFRSVERPITQRLTRRLQRPAGPARPLVARGRSA